MSAEGHILRGCPRCFAPMDLEQLEQSGGVHCVACGLNFTAAVFEPVERAPAQIVPLDSSATAPCARHARNAAIAACESCGAFMCTLCRVTSGGKVICAACFDRERANAESMTTFTSWRTLAGYSGLASLFIWPFSFLFGPLAIFASVRAIFQNRKTEEGTVVGPIVSALAGLAGMAFGISLFWNFIRRLPGFR